MQKTISSVVLALVLALVLACAAFGAVPVTIESNRAHAASGSFGCTVSGATVATPSIITCAAAHNLADGDLVQITGVGGTTTVNTTGYAKVTSVGSATTFGLYSDAALATGVTGTGSYTSGGKVVGPLADISGFTTTADFTLRLVINGLTAAKNAVVCIQDSVDGFVSDTVTLACVNPSGAVASGASIDFTWRKYQLPSARFGVTAGRLRVNIQSIDGSATATTSLYIQ